MCIIVSKAKGVKMPSKEILERCFETNPDGAGFMYERNGKVQIRKGFMTFEEFYESIEKLNRICGSLKDIPLVMHFRISTGGKVDKGNCHPYPIIDNDKALRSGNYTTNIGMAHNGIIRGYDDPKKVLNDTQMFIKDVVSTFYQYDINFLKNNKVLNILEDIADSKLCFLDSNGDITYIGDFIEDDGIMYSNSSYLKRSYYPLYSGYNLYSEYSDYGDYGIDDYYDLLEKVEANGVLSHDEFDVLLDYLMFLQSSDVIVLRSDEIIEVGSKNYAIDDFNTLYVVDYELERIKVVDYDVDVTDMETLKENL